VNVPYSSEYSDRDTNLALLKDLAGLSPQGGKAGEVIEGELRRENIDDLLKVDTFRHTLAKAVSSNHIWPLIVLVAAGVFFADVFLRRVSISFEWVGVAWAWIATRVFRREQAPVADERIERLRSRKAAMTAQLEERRAQTQFAPQADAPVGPAAASSARAPLAELEQGANVDDILRGASGSRDASAPTGPTAGMGGAGMGPPQADQETYVQRLMKAKKKAFDEKG
jgi:hypothetical protein